MPSAGAGLPSTSSTPNMEEPADMTTVVSTTTISESESTTSLVVQASPVSSDPPTSAHRLVILGTVIGIIVLVSLLLILVVFLLRRRKTQEKNTDRESQILEPYCQDKVSCVTPCQGSPVSQDQGEVVCDRARLEELESTVQLLLNRQRQSAVVSEMEHDPPPDYASTRPSLSVDRTGRRISTNSG
ncbi:uncharacterized protein EV420DRAFT_1651865 [Desarmillaria tabescens]|uniref:Uncharacterized protein n=1 Tax=Armillaria tabescens TaxID=1929756 RepID=A0AA39JA48_ARMTA|nr:uncharacterized protein EV420DRAFT_1651865 [Desarmillaria tabescens]KAK0437604.1 hypothetical protein EV420DRAFT_1651865 [Desarmillaria tabescens]